MKAFYMLYSEVNNGKLVKCDTLDDARREAKIAVNRDRGNSSDVVIMKAIEVVRQPIPDAEIVPVED